MNKKLLVILPTLSDFALKNGSRFPSGYFISELYIPVYHWENAGIDISYATQKACKPACDERSALYMSKVKLRDAKDYFETNEAYQNPLDLDQLTDKDLETFDGVFIPGSYSTNEELIQSDKFKALLTYFHQRKKIIILMSQSVYLISVLNPIFSSEGVFPTIACFPEEREKAIETIDLKSKLSFHIEPELAEMGFPIRNINSPLKPNVVNDKHFITTQDQYSTGSVMRLLLKILSSKRGLQKLI